MSEGLAERLVASLPMADAAPAVLDGYIAEARDSFVALGLPGARDEAWRYSSLRSLENLQPTNTRAEPAIAAAMLPGVDSSLARFSGGAWQIGAELPEGVRVTTPDGEQLPPQVLNRWLPSDFDRADAFAWLNAADGRQALLIEVEGAVAGQHSLDLVHDVIGLSQFRVMVIVQPGASIRLLERWTGSDLATGLSNCWIQVCLEAGASLDWLRLQENGVAARAIQRSDFELGACAVLRHQAVELGGLWTRHDLRFSLRGREADLKSSGVFVPSGRQHVDTQLAIDHCVGATTSRTLWKGVAQGRARGVFDGSIAVRPGADGTAAHLKTANLLLSPHAEIDAKPELIIEADEVQCSHGATVGQLDERALFYLRSRGLPEALARRMLTVAFCSEALRSIEPVSLREAIEALVTAHLPEFSAG